MTHRILIWGLLEDPTLHSVFECLQSTEANVTFVNHAVIHGTRVQVAVDDRVRYDLSSESTFCQLDCVTAAYLRPYDVRHYELPATEAARNGVCADPQLTHQLMNTWAEYSSAKVINRPSAEGTNHSKLYQALRIGEGGFLTPPCLVTNDRDQALAFLGTHGRVIYKSMSSIRSIVKELSARDLHGIDLGPVLFQQLITGRQVRVHVVGEQCFGCAIDCDDVDYRYAPNRRVECSIPPDIARRCVALSRSLHLELAGLDLIEAWSGDWYCLEVNTNPGFSYYDTTGERSVAWAVAEALLA